MGFVSVPVSAPVAVPVFPVLPAVPVASGLAMAVFVFILCAVLVTVSTAMWQSQSVRCVAWDHAHRLPLLHLTVEKPGRAQCRTCLWSVSASTSRAFSSPAQGLGCGHAPCHHRQLPSLLLEPLLPTAQNRRESIISLRMPAQKGLQVKQWIKSKLRHLY